MSGGKSVRISKGLVAVREADYLGDRSIIHYCWMDGVSVQRYLSTGSELTHRGARF